MKKITQIIILSIVLVLSATVEVEAQNCGPENNISQPIGPVGVSTDILPNNGQSFLVECNGAIDAISVFFGPVSGAMAGNADFILYTGESDGVTPLVPIVSIPFATIVNGEVKITLPNDIPVAVGERYTYIVSNATNTAGLRGTTGNPYANGSIWTSTAANPNTFANGYGTDPDLQFIIHYVDTVNPVITCPANIVTPNDTGNCGAIVDFNATATDNDSATITYSQNPNTSFPVGTTTVVATATDPAGNTDSCSFDVMVVDAEDPVVVCQDITVQLDTSGEYLLTPNEVVASSSDNCGVDSIEFAVPIPFSLTTSFADNNNFRGNMFDIMALNDITINSFDVNAEAGTHDYVVYMKAGSYVGSQNNAADWTLVGSATGVTSAGASAPTPLGLNMAVSVDAGDIVSFYIYNLTGNDFNYINGTAEGNLWANDANLEIYEGIGKGDPIFTGSTFSPRNFSGNIVYQAGFTGISDLLLNCTDTGDVMVDVLVTDVNGNSSTCAATITVEDNVMPVAICTAPFTVQLDAMGMASITVADIDNGSTDNCGIESTTIDVMDFTCADVGINTVTLTVTDVNGNSSTCTTDVTVEDNVMPVAMCAAPFTVQLDAMGMASITVADIDNGSTDNCGIASTTIDVMDFTCADIGVNTVTLTVTDVNGNSSTCTTDVTVEDNVAPAAVCMNITVPLDANGIATITPADVDGGSTDACGIATTAIDVDTFDCSNVGSNNVILTITDVNGNVATCTAVVTIEDNTVPTIACPADIITETTPGDCFTEVSFPDALALDTCGIASITQTMGAPSGSMFPVGDTIIEFTATDVNGNTSTCMFTITVMDMEPAMAVCQDITVQLDGTGMVTITPADVDGGSADNCGVANTTIDMDTFDCSNLGSNNVTLTVTDVNGNVSTCVAVVTVEDIESPMVVCQDIIVQLDATGTLTIVASDLDNGSTDNCTIADFTLDIDTFDCSNVGSNTVIVTATDVSGNTAMCTATVTVEDVTAPDLVCMDFTLELGADGTATLDAASVIASNTDACGIDTSAVDITQFDCSDIGTPVLVEVFTQDVNGNIANCMATVTVVDMLEPEVTCPADITVDPGAGMVNYEVPDYVDLGEATALDNCTDPVMIFTQDPAAGTFLPDGVYPVTITAEDEYGNIGSCTFTLTVESVLGGISTNEISLATLVMYPNPAKDFVILSNPQAINLNQVSIYDINGRLVRTVDLQDMGTEKTIDITNLQNATYVFVIQSDYGVITKQIFKE